MKMSPEHKALHDKIDEILWQDWDPIGVNYTEEARDEYQNYTPMIFSLKIAGADVEGIASKLLEIETKWMGLYNGDANCKKVAQKIFDLNA